MSLTDALNASRSGLVATQTWSQLTARNIANANTDGYVRKDISFGTRTLGGGGTVQVTEIRREIDGSLTRMYRGENSKMAKYQAIYEGIGEYTATLGQPSDEFSPASRLTQFQTSLDTLVNSPGNAGAQRGVLDSAQALATSLNTASDTLGRVQGEVSREIKYDVSDVNRALYKIADLNRQLSGNGTVSVAGADMQDEIDRQIQKISQIMDVRVSHGTDGQVNLYTAGGSALIEGDKVSDVRYDEPSGKLYAGQTEITPNSSSTRGFENGSLAGLFSLKDDVLPRYQLQLDEFARSLVQGFEGADASLSAGQAGLFTDAGAAYDSTKLQGLAGRIAVNDAVKPDKGGTLSRLRDGIGASTSGPAGDATQLNAFAAVFDQPLTIDPATKLPDGMTLADYASNMVAAQHVEGSRAQTNYNTSRTTAETVDASRQSVQGVNIDDELQKMMVIQQSYAANSKMMTTVMNMIDTLLQAV